MGKTLILIQRCTFRSAVVFFRSRRLLSSTVVFSPSSLVDRRLQPVFSSSSLLLLVNRPSSVVNRLLFIYRPLQPSFDRSISPLDYDIARGSCVNFDRASSSSVVSQAVLRAAVCWSEEDNFIPFITGSGFSLKFPI